MKATAFIQLSRRLARQRSEASQRTAISRAYYGAFLHMRDHLAEGQVPPAGVRIHAWVQQEARGRDPLAALALQTLRRLQNSADYDIAGPLTPGQVDEALHAAGDVLERFPPH